MQLFGAAVILAILSRAGWLVQGLGSARQEIGAGHDLDGSRMTK